MKLIATFTAQAWWNDYVREVCAQGATSWDVTEYLRAMDRDERIAACQSDTPKSDALREADEVPQWIRDWTGPFFVTVRAQVETDEDRLLLKIVDAPEEVFDWVRQDAPTGILAFTNAHTAERYEAHVVGSSIAMSIEKLPEAVAAEVSPISQSELAPEAPVMTLQDELTALVERGLEFSDVMAVMGVTADENPMVAAARNKARESQVEVDDKTILSEGGPEGCYVLAWLWVENPDFNEDEEDEEDEQQSPLAA